MIRSMMAYAFLVALSLWMLVVFTYMWFNDIVIVREPILPIRAIETALFVGLIILGVERLIHWVRIVRRGRK